MGDSGDSPATVVLVGMMGSGKTSIGRRLAKRLGRVFVDADEGFVARYGRTIADVFATDGEDAFRAMEAELLADVLDVAEPLVVATGGGAVLRKRTRKRLSLPDVTVLYLDASVEHLVARSQAKAHRPLLAGADPAEVFGRLHAERDRLYREVADIVVDVQGPGGPGDVDKDSVVEWVAGSGILGLS